MVAKSADEARAQATARAAQQAFNNTKASAAKAAADKAAAAKASAAKASARAKETAAANALIKKAQDQIKKTEARIAQIEKSDAATKATATEMQKESDAAAAETKAAVAAIRNPQSPVVVDPYNVDAGSTGFTDTNKTVTLARNTFANTLALLVGEKEASQPWVNELYDLQQGFINTGSTIEEAQNLALREAKKLGKASKFVQRFDPIFKLQDRLNAGETVYVPSIAEYVKSEQELGDVLRAVNLGELATQEVAARILGDANKSVSEASSIIANVFAAIDNAPGALRNDLQTILNKGVDRVSIAKALLTGKEGALELTKKVKSIEQFSAAKSQGVAISLETGADLVAGGADYSTSLGKFETVKQLERGQSLGRMSNIDFTQQDAIASAFQSNASANEKIRMIEEQEKNRFAGRSGRLQSQDRAQGLI